MDGIPREAWVIVWGALMVVLVILLLLTIRWRRRRTERWQNEDQLASVHNSRERRNRGD